MANWWVLALYMVLGLSALAMHASQVRNERERRGARLVLFGAVFGLIPFLVLAVAFPSILRTERFIFYGVGPLLLFPLTFAYAIVRFQLLDIKVILRRSLLYTVTSAVVTLLYAVMITLSNVLTRGTPLANSPYFPILFALTIMLLFEPLRRRIQILVERAFHGETARLQQAMVQMGSAFAAEADLEAVVRDLVGELPRLLELRFAALYLDREGMLSRIAGPDELPDELTLPPELGQLMSTQKHLTRLEDLRELRSAEVTRLSRHLASRGVEAMGQLSSPRRRVGVVLLSGRTGQTPLEDSELALLDGLLNQAAIALEASVLLEERTRQIELERDIEIAASVQSSLLPDQMELAAGWEVAAMCRPARHIGGDFYTVLPAPENGTGAIVYGDVAGKSVAGALVMMAAHEVLHSLALGRPPGRGALRPGQPAPLPTGPPQELRRPLVPGRLSGRKPRLHPGRSAPAPAPRRRWRGHGTFPASAPYTSWCPTRR